MLKTIATTSTDTLVSLLSHLIRFPTLTADKRTNRAALEWVEEQLRGLPLHLKHLEHQGHPALVATTRPTRNPKLWLSGHMDVVPTATSEFKPVVRDGRVYGRGAHDMKSGLAMFIALLQELGGDLTAYDLGLMITSDEEIGGYAGVRWLLEQGYRGGTALMPDSGISWGFETGSKGIIWLNLSSGGRAAHASRTWDGLNAIDQIIGFVEALRSNLPPEPCGNPEHQHASLNLGVISGGSVPNQVPDAATARVDLRIPPELGRDSVSQWITEAAGRYPGVTYEIPLSDPAYQINNMAPTRLFSKLAHDITGQPPTTAIAHGSSDARHFAAYGIPTVNVSPAGSGFHVPNEWVDLAGLGQYYEVLRKFVDDIAKN